MKTKRAFGQTPMEQMIAEDDTYIDQEGIERNFDGTKAICTLTDLFEHMRKKDCEELDQFVEDSWIYEERYDMDF